MLAFGMDSIMDFPRSLADKVFAHCPMESIAFLRVKIV
jgi:hypothetical protein